MVRRQPRFTRPDTFVPSPTLFRSPPEPAWRFHPVAGPAAAPASDSCADVEHWSGEAAWSRQGRADIVALGEAAPHHLQVRQRRSEEHTSELQSLMRISYAVFCLQNKKIQTIVHYN